MRRDVRTAVRRLRDRGAAVRGPVLSAVVPVFQVEGYLDRTLASLAEQTYERFEVVVVDDGSTDGTADVARAWAGRDPRFRLVQQENQGVSAARNTGVEHAGGRYLTFVDGDDTLPPDSWRVLLGSLQRTGSDFAVGKIERVDGDRRFVTPWMARNHETPLEGARVEDRPTILADVFPVNKVYLRSFWDAQGLAFPPGRFYEDQPVMTRGFLAGTFDVLTETVYHYLLRADGTSTTQLRHELRDLEDRVVTKRMTVESVRAHGDERVRTVFLADVLPVDMWEYFRSVPGCTDAYWDLLRACVREFWTPATVQFHETSVPVQQRLMGWLVAQGRREDLERLLAWLDSGAERFVQEGGLRLLDHPWRSDPDVPVRCTQAGEGRPVR